MFPTACLPACDANRVVFRLLSKLKTPSPLLILAKIFENKVLPGAWITYKLCLCHFQPQKVSGSVGSKILGKMRSENRYSLDAKTFRKMYSEHRFVCEAKIIKGMSCIICTRHIELFFTSALICQ